MRRRTVLLGSAAVAIAAGAAVFATTAAGSTPARPQPVQPVTHSAIGYVSGYDAATGRIRVQDAQWIPGGLDNGHFELRPGVRELPLAPDAVARGAVALCSTAQPAATPLTLDQHGNGTRSCTPAQLIAGLQAGHPAFATVSERNGQAVAVVERYVP